MKLRKLLAVKEITDDQVTFFELTSNGRIKLDSLEQKQFRKQFKNIPGEYTFNTL